MLLQKGERNDYLGVKLKELPKRKEGYESFVTVHKLFLERADEILRHERKRDLSSQHCYLESVDFEKGIVKIHYIDIEKGVSVQSPSFPSVHRRSIEAPADLMYRDDWKRRYNDLEAELLARGSNVLEEKSVS